MKLYNPVKILLICSGEVVFYTNAYLPFTLSFNAISIPMGISPQ